MIVVKVRLSERAGVHVRERRMVASLVSTGHVSITQYAGGQIQRAPQHLDGSSPVESSSCCTASRTSEYVSRTRLSTHR